MSDLCNAVWNRNFEEVERLLAKGGVDVNHKDGGGHTPLIKAAIYGYIQMVYILFLSGADLHATNLGCTAAQCACQNGYPVLAAFLDLLAATAPTITLSSSRMILRRYSGASTHLQRERERDTAPLQVPLTLHFFLAGLPFQPNPQPAYHTIVHHEGLWLAVIVPWLRDVALPLYATQPEVKAFVDTMLQNVVAMNPVPDGAVQFLVATFPDAMTKEFVHKTLLNHEGLLLTVIGPWLRGVALPLYATQPEMRASVDTMLQNMVAMYHPDVIATNAHVLQAIAKAVTLQDAVAKDYSDVFVRFLLATFPEDFWTTTDCGDTVLHTLAAAHCSTTARHTNTLCFTLVEGA